VNKCVQAKPEPTFPDFPDQLPDVTGLRPKVEKMSNEVADHRGRLEELSVQQDQAVETANKLQADVSKVESEIGDMAKLRASLEETSDEVQRQRGTLDEITTQHEKTAQSVQHLQTDVTNIQSEVGDVLKLYLYYGAK